MTVLVEKVTGAWCDSVCEGWERGDEAWARRGWRRTAQDRPFPALAVTGEGQPRPLPCAAEGYKTKPRGVLSLVRKELLNLPGDRCKNSWSREVVQRGESFGLSGTLDKAAGHLSA